MFIFFGACGPIIYIKKVFSIYGNHENSSDIKTNLTKV